MIILGGIGLTSDAFAETRKVTFFDDGAAVGTNNPFVNDPKTNAYADVVAPQTIRGQSNTNLDRTEPGALPPAEKVIFIDSSNVIGPCSGFGGGPHDVFKGHEEGAFAFTGLNPTEKFQVTVVLSDMDDCGLEYRLFANPNDPLIPALETVFVRGNAVELGLVDSAGLGQGDHDIQKTFTTLAMPDGNGDLIIGFNLVYSTAGHSGFGVEQIVITSDDLDREVGGELLPIDSTALLLANTQSFSWMIPLVLSGIGIGLFVVSRKP
jgi:hypothetical protein